MVVLEDPDFLLKGGEGDGDVSPEANALRDDVPDDEAVPATVLVNQGLEDIVAEEEQVVGLELHRFQLHIPVLAFSVGLDVRLPQVPVEFGGKFVLLSQEINDQNPLHLHALLGRLEEGGGLVLLAADEGEGEDDCDEDCSFHVCTPWLVLVISQAVYYTLPHSLCEVPPLHHAGGVQDGPEAEASQDERYADADEHALW